MRPPIYTMDARGNMMLEVVQQQFKLSSEQMLREINICFDATLQILEQKKIDYASLKRALVPSTDRHEVALIFDSQKIESSWYGFKVSESFLPALSPDGTHSVLCGDLTSNNRKQEDFLFEQFSESLVSVRTTHWSHSSQYFAVYINNLSDQAFKRLTEHLATFQPYVGYIPCDDPSFMKTYFSLTLAHSFTKVKKVILQGHEDDRDDEEDVNMVGYRFEKYGYKCKSFRSMYHDLFLHYKIERGVYPGFESDTLFSLNSISKDVISLHECEVLVEDAKLGYLQSEKEGSMKRSGLIALSKEALEAQIKVRLQENYIFNMAYSSQHGTMKFNTILAVYPMDTEKCEKLLISLEYKPKDKLVRLITMF